MFNILNDNVHYFSNYFVYTKETHKYCTRNDSKLHCELIPKTNNGFTTFYYRGIKLWNSLPMNVTNSTELTTYKTNLKRHILCIQNESL